MAFYKQENGEILEAPTHVYMPGGVTLNADQHETYTYPVNGWTWYDTQEQAMATLGLENPIELVSLQHGVEVTRFQARAALLQAGLLDQIDGWIDTYADPLSKLAWKEGLTFRRDSTIMQTLATQIGLSTEQLDALFVAASQIKL